MEVKEIFAMRKEGRVEEAYRAISEIYAVHQGPHTNLCMFWCASDMFKLRAKEKNAKEARRYLGQMVKVYTTINDDSHLAARAISKAALAMDKMVENFNLVYFVGMFNKLTDEDWKPYIVNGHKVPSLGQQIVNHLLKNIETRNLDYIHSIIGIFRVAVQKDPKYNQKNYQRMKAAIDHLK